MFMHVQGISTPRTKASGSQRKDEDNDEGPVDGPYVIPTQIGKETLRIGKSLDRRDPSWSRQNVVTMTAESRGETGCDSGSGERRSGGNRRPGRLLPPTSVMVALSIVAMATAALCAYCSMSGSNVLTVSIPSSALLRRVRSFTEHPNLSELTLNITTLHANFRILDSAECESDPSKCTTYAVCDNQQGEMTCRCQRGYYLDGQKCQLCRTSCPRGYYMVKPCTTKKDVVCKACDVCKGTEYEITPCRAAQNRKCIDVTFPTHQIRYDGKTCSKVADNNSLQLMPSGNVFVERLNSIKELETTMYVTNNQQAMDFIWKRESGLQVKASITDVFLVPEYVDIDHSDDNQYFLQSVFVHSELKQTFRNILKSYCRHPLPDYYNMILEVHPNRSTNATVVICDSKNPAVPQCPKSYSDGQKYIKRSTNNVCPKLKGKRLKALSPAANSIVCLDESPLLTAIFGMKTANVTELMFRSRECENFTKSCLSCIQRGCRNSNIYSPIAGPLRGENSCCQIPCYRTYSCRKSYDSLCPPSPVECATGDAYVFTLRPMFNSISSQFFCHLQYKKPTKLYSINYSVDIPQVGYQFKEKHRTVLAESTGFHHHSLVTVDFISVEHSSQLPVREQAILVKDHSRADFSLHSLKKAEDFDRKFDINNPTDNIFSTDAQFSKPFEYSSMTWHNGGCGKNSSKIYPAQLLFVDHGDSVNAHKSVFDGRFHYHISNTKETPQIKLLISANSSILKHYQHDFPNALLNSSSLEVKLFWQPVLKNWMMKIKGVLYSCPGYLRMKVYDSEHRICYGSYDMFINCPTTFQISAVLTEWGNKQPSILTVMLSDIESTHRLHLTTHEINKDYMKPSSNSYRLKKHSTVRISPWKPVIAILVSASILGTMMLCTLAGLLIYNVGRRTIPSLPPPSPAQDERRSSLLSSPEQERPLEIIPRPPTETSRGLVFLFIVIYLMYSFFFTLSVTLGLFYVIIGPSVISLQNTTEMSYHVRQSVNRCLEEIKAHEKFETMRMLDLIKQRQISCQSHLDTEVTHILQGMHSSTRMVLRSVYRDNGLLKKSVHDLFMSKQFKFESELNEFICDTNHTLYNQLLSFRSKYINFLKKLVHNQWLEFPKKIFERHGSINDVFESENSLLEYLNWLEVDKVFEVSQVHDIIMKQMVESKPIFPGNDILATNPGRNIKSVWIRLHTELEERTWELSKTRHVFRYLLSHAFSYEDTSNRDYYQDIQYEEKREISSGGSKTFFSVLVAIFIILDALLLFYRFKWMKCMLSQIRCGYVQKLPMDTVSSKVYAIQTGRSAPRPYNPLEHPYSYYQDNKEDIWSASELYFAQAPTKSKEDILREIWNHRRRQEPKLKRERLKDFCFVQYFIQLCRLILRILGSKLFLKLILFALVVFFLGIFLAAADAILTADNIKLFLDRHLGASQLKDHLLMSDNTLINYADYLNRHLVFIKKFVDWEIADFNAVLEGVRQNQRQLLNKVLEDICNIMGNTSSSSSQTSCSSPPSLPTTTITSCNFMSIQPQFYDGILQEVSVQLLQNNLTSTELASRQMVFHSVYLLLFLACGMFLSHAVAQVINYYVFHESKVPILRIYQTTSSSSPWPEHHNCTVKDMHRSASWLQSSESGVYLGDNEENVRESAM
ncbi:uncharacterized protein LOC115209230 isoform X4 [Octopus sinensis]|uniref:Uncharacterized protein LOC115209230 isoform X4 n=1 Tax=Octopus sinensis TaxID=2607531 RepID=A0A7E6EQU5_9MOLL|nr:uncharacterized protein LOC115209230 isoform X4 [Octopus sinensis]